MKKRLKRLISAWRLGVWFYKQCSPLIAHKEPIVLIYNAVEPKTVTSILPNFPEEYVVAYLANATIETYNTLDKFNELKSIIDNGNNQE